jgi:hypothetical protein
MAGTAGSTSAPPVVGGVRPLKRIGEDLFRETWSAERDGVKVAVHVLKATAANGTPFEAMLLGGATRLSQVTQPGVLRVHEVFPSDRAYVTDLWTVGTAADVGALGWSVRRKITMFEAVCSALGRLHASGLVHGCLRPENVLFDDELHPVLADAGMIDIALALGGDPDGAFGYGPYACAEARYGMPMDVRADVFAAGKLLQFLMMGDAPEDAVEPLPRLESMKDQAPPGIIRIVRKCVQGDPDGRYASMTALMEDVLRWQETQAVGVAHPEVQEVEDERWGERDPSNHDLPRLGDAIDSFTSGVRPTGQGQRPHGPVQRPAGQQQAPAPGGAPPLSAPTSSTSPPPRVSRLSVTQGAQGPLSARTAGSLSSRTGGLNGPTSKMFAPPEGAFAPKVTGSAAKRAGFAIIGAVGLALALAAGAAVGENVALRAVAAVSVGIAACALPARGSRAALYRAGYAAAAACVVFAADPVAVAAVMGARAALRSGDLASRVRAVRALGARGYHQFENVSLEGAFLAGANLTEANLERANLTGAQMEGTNLRRAVLRDANLSNANLENAFLHNADMRGAKLDGARGLDHAWCNEHTAMPQGWACGGNGIPRPKD